MPSTDQIARAAARRSLVFALPPHDSEALRGMDAVEARKLLQQAACLAARAGNNEVANGALTLLERLEESR